MDRQGGLARLWGMRRIALTMGGILLLLGWLMPVTPGFSLAPPDDAFKGPVPYTGVILNKTRYRIDIPSDNSEATLVIPPYGWIEYTIWTKHLDVTAYHNGNVFYCLKIDAHPQDYSYKCKKYDFMAEIVKPAGVGKYKYKPLRKRIKKKPEC